MKKSLLSLCALASLALAQSNTQIANEVAKDLLKTLGGNLKKHLKAEGPQGALHFCANNAYDLTQKVSDKYGKKIDVKRISLKPRNPANTPNTEEAAVLKEMEAAYKKSGKPKAVVVEENGTTIVYKPLVIKKKACIICHGDVAKNDPKLYKKIKSIYPSDKAIGYKMGDLRGAIVVTIKK